MTNAVDSFADFLSGLQAKAIQKSVKPAQKQVWQPKSQVETAHRAVEKPVIGRAVIRLNIVDQAGNSVAQYVVRYQLVRGRNGSKVYEDCTKAEFEIRHGYEAEIIESTLKVWGEL